MVKVPSSQPSLQYIQLFNKLFNAKYGLEKDNNWEKISRFFNDIEVWLRRRGLLTGEGRFEKVLRVLLPRSKHEKNPGTIFRHFLADFSNGKTFRHW